MRQIKMERQITERLNSSRDKSGLWKIKSAHLTPTLETRLTYNNSKQNQRGQIRMDGQIKQIKTQHVTNVE